MKEQFIPYEIAVQLKQLGFNQECIGYYNQQTEELFPYQTTTSTNGHKCAAPLWQQAFDWLREEHKIFGYVIPFKDHAADNNDPIIFKTNYTGNKEFETYNTAELELLEQLIKEIKSNLPF